MIKVATLVFSTYCMLMPADASLVSASFVAWSLPCCCGDRGGFDNWIFGGDEE